MGEPELALPAAVAPPAGRRPSARPRVRNPYTLAPEHYSPDGLTWTRCPCGWELFHGRGRYPFLSVLSSRGCPAGCRFCPYVAARAHSNAAFPRVHG